MKRLGILFLGLVSASNLAFAQKATPQIQQEINQYIQSNNQNAISGYILNGILNDIAISYANNISNGIANIGPLQPGYSSVLGLGSAANQSIGTSGATLCLLNANCTWSGTQTFPAGSLTAAELAPGAAAANLGFTPAQVVNIKDSPSGAPMTGTTHPLGTAWGSYPALTPTQAQAICPDATSTTQERDWCAFSWAKNQVKALNNNATLLVPGGNGGMYITSPLNMTCIDDPNPISFNISNVTSVGGYAQITLTNSYVYAAGMTNVYLAGTGVAGLDGGPYTITAGVVNSMTLNVAYTSGWASGGTMSIQDGCGAIPSPVTVPFNVKFESRAICATSGKPCIDGLGSNNVVLQNYNVYGVSGGLEPSVPIQIGRTVTQIAAANWTLYSPQSRGYFSKSTSIYNFGSEGMNVINPEMWNADAAGTWQYTAKAPTIATGGSGCTAASQNLTTATGGTVLTSSISGGAVTAVSILPGNGGLYPTNGTANPVSVTGSDCSVSPTFNLSYEPWWTGAYSIIFDYDNIFHATSNYVTETIPVGYNAETLDGALISGGNFYNIGTGAGAPQGAFISGTSGLRIDHTYLTSSKYCVTIYNDGLPPPLTSYPTMLYLGLHCEPIIGNIIDSYVHIMSPVTTVFSIPGLQINEFAFMGNNAVFSTDNTGNITLSDLSLHMPWFNYPGTHIFDTALQYYLTGSLYFPAASDWTIPGSMSGVACYGVTFTCITYSNMLISQKFGTVPTISVSGGGCTAPSTITNGGVAGQFTMTGTTDCTAGAATFTFTFGQTVPHQYACSLDDQSAGLSAVSYGAPAVNQCIMKFTTGTVTHTDTLILKSAIGE